MAQIPIPSKHEFHVAEDPTYGIFARWNTAYTRENAEAAQAYLEAYEDTRRRTYLDKALTILRAIAKHRCRRTGFLTEGVDWDNRVGAQHHIRKERYGLIRYTEPFLNNLHVVEPTLYYLENFANVSFRDPEGVLLFHSRAGRPPSKSPREVSRFHQASELKAVHKSVFRQPPVPGEI